MFPQNRTRARAGAPVTQTLQSTGAHHRKTQHGGHNDTFELLIQASMANLFVANLFVVAFPVSVRVHVCHHNRQCVCPCPGTGKGPCLCPPTVPAVPVHSSIDSDNDRDSDSDSDGNRDGDGDGETGPVTGTGEMISLSQTLVLCLCLSRPLSALSLSGLRCCCPCDGPSYLILFP